MPAEALRLLRAGSGEDVLICFPFLGGSAQSYAAMSRALPRGWAVWGVDLPGHGRHPGVARTSVAEVLAVVIPELMAVSGTRVVLFGHSYGALLAVAAGCVLEAQLRPPSLVIASAASPPSTMVESGVIMGGLGDDQLLEYMTALRALPIGLTQGSTVARMVLPTLRADLAVLASADVESLHLRESPLAVLAFRGDAVAPPERMQEWEVHGTLLRFKVVEGSHLAPVLTPAAMSRAVGDILGLLKQGDVR